MIDLNILKIAGAFVAGLAGLIGILGETRTQDKKLTRSGKWLFAMAVVGVLLAVSTQIWEWMKSIEDDRAARQHNREILERLDNEATLAASSLHEIRRAVTRFQTISFDWSLSFDSTDKVFGPYIHDLANLAEEAISKPWANLQESHQGLRVGMWMQNPFEVHGLRFDADSPAMPDEGKYAILRHYILEALPDITLFKTPISPAAFFTTFPFGSNQASPRPDLIFKLSSGKVSVTFPIQKLEPKVPKITIEHSDMIASVSDSQGRVVSLDDLAGCQGILSFSPRVGDSNLMSLWKTASEPHLTCHVNGQQIPLSELISTHASQESHVRPQLLIKSDYLIYSFTFPTPAPAKNNH